MKTIKETLELMNADRAITIRELLVVKFGDAKMEDIAAEFDLGEFNPDEVE